MNPQLLEAMSKDLGNTSAGFTNNFVFGTLALGNNTYVKLVDQSDNAVGSGAEAVYANSVIVPAGCTLNLNGISLYARGVQISGSVVGGTISQLPDSGALSIAAYTPGGLSVAGELDEWTFFARAGRLVSVLVNPGTTGSPPALSPTLQWVKARLLDPDGNEIASGSSASSGAVVTLNNLVLPADGTYKLRINAPAGHTSATGNYIVGVWDVTPTVRSLNIGQTSAGSIATPFALDQWNFSGSAAQQVRLDVLATSNSGMVFKLVGPGNSVLFQDLATDSALINLPSTGSYTLSAYGLNGATGSYSFILKQTTVTNLPTGTLYNGTWAGSGSAQLFSIPVGVSGPMSVALTDANTANHAELYVRFGAPPTRTTFDYSNTSAGASHTVLVPFAQQGTWYVLVYGESIPSGTGGFTLQATSQPVVVFGTSLRRSATNLDTSFTLTGAGFTPTSTVVLIGPGGAEFAATSSTTDSPTQITAIFGSGTLPAGDYTAKVALPGGGYSILPMPIRIEQVGQGVLTTRVEVPGQLRRNGLATLYVNYSNTGNAPMPAPLLILDGTTPEGQSGAFLTLNSDLQTSGFWTSATPAGFSNSVQILASGSTPGLLQPGESMRVPVYYSGWIASQWLSASPRLTFSLRAVYADDVTAVDWASMESSMRPANIAAEAWHVMYASLLAQLGGTAGGFVQVLDTQASYLARLGQNVTDVNRLWGFAVAQAQAVWPMPTLGGTVDDSLPTPGALSLSFGRAFNQTIPGRFKMGPLGLGWFTPWQQRVTVATDGTATLETGSGGGFIYQPDRRYAGRYFSQPGDHNVFTSNGSGYELTAPNGTITAFDATGALNFVQDTNGNRITASYTAGRLTSLTATSGASLTLGYNAAGLIATLTDSTGRSSSYAYDAANQHLLSVTSFTGRVTSYAYNTTAGAAAQNALTSITFPDGTHQFFTHDALGRIASTFADGNALTKTFSYARGQVTVRDALSNAISLFFDHNGQLARTIDALGNPTIYDYDDTFNLTRVTNATGASASYAYDNQGRVTLARDFLGNTTSLVYGGSQRQLTALTDANGNTTRYSYNAAGNLTATTFANSKSERFTFDPLGNALSFTNAAGSPTQYAYNAAGQLTSASFADGGSFTYTYDAEGHLLTAVDATGTTSFTYDATTRLLTRIDYPGGRWLAFSYDAGGRRTQMADQTGFTTNYLYDAVARLASLRDGSNQLIVSYNYDAAGRLDRKDNANGTYSTYAYDANGNVLHLINYAPDGSINSRFDDTYNSLGLKTSEATLDGVWSYSYDATGQLTRAVFASNNTATTPHQDLAYNYDAMGNRTSTVINGVTTAYVPNNMNQYTSVGGVAQSYDANGNLTSDGSTSFVYNTLNKLVSSTGPGGTTTYTYNALGQRVASTTSGQTTNYITDPAGLGNVVGTYDGTGALLAHFTHGLGLVSQTTAATHFYDFDPLGSTAGMSNATGTYANRYAYLPFGGSQSSSATVANVFGFVGQWGVELQPSTSVLWARARILDEVTGRFDSRDPIGSLRTSRLYGYADNNPIQLIDPSGLICIDNIGWGRAVGANRDVSDQVENGTWDWFHNSYPQNLAALHDFFLHQYHVLTGGSYKDSNPWVWAIHAFLISGAALGWEAVVADFAGNLDNATFGECVDAPDVEAPNVPGGTNASSTQTTGVTAVDPNALYGPAGYGASNFVPGSNFQFPYRIEFENDKDASAPAQNVSITNNLSSSLDAATFQLTGLGFGDVRLTVPAGSAQHFQTTVEMTYNGQTFNVEIEAGIHSATGQVYAVFQSIDPNTSLPPSNPLTGFLPPEDGTGRGQGFITYTIAPKTLTTGTQITNVASIVFDAGVIITTDQVDPHDASKGTDPTKRALVTIDAEAPAAQMNALPAFVPLTFPVSWSAATDAAGGSGVAGYTVYVSEDGGSFSPWLVNTTSTSANFTGVSDKDYSFYVAARDHAGNTQAVNPITDSVSTRALGHGLIAVEQPAGTALTSGTSTVDFGLAAAPAGHVETFVIRNTGPANLTLGAPTFTGAHASDFRIVTAPAASITPNASTTCVIKFVPGASTTRTAVLHFPSNDTGHTPFDVNVTGTGVAATAIGSIKLTLLPASAVAAGAYWRVDAGRWRLSGETVDGIPKGPHTIGVTTLPGWTSPTIPVVTVVGAKTTALSALYTAPFLQVEQPATKVIAHSTGTVSFGNVQLTKSAALTFTLRNIGQLPLSNLTPTITGINATEFTITTPPSSSVLPGKTTTLAITFAPTAIDARNAVLHITSNDPTKQAGYDVNLTGTGMIAPSVTTPPASQWVGLGQPATFTVNATGGALKYQWLKNNVALAGATALSYTLPKTVTAHAGAYAVKVSNAVNSATSATANLGIASLAPSTVLVNEGSTLSLTVIAAAPGITHQWQKNGAALTNGVNPLNAASTIAGATSSKLTITKAVAADSDTYTCVLKMPDPQNAGSFISQTSGIFTVKVVLAPDVLDPQAMPDGIVSGSYTHQIKIDTNPLRMPTSYATSPLPLGLKLDVKTGIISGKPLVTGTFTIKLTAINSKGNDSATDTIFIAPFPGNIAGIYAGPVAREATLNGDLGGRLDMTISANGVISGKLALGAVTPHSLVGAVDIDVTGAAVPSGTVILKRTGAPTLTMVFTIDTSQSVLTAASVTDGTHTAVITGWRNTWVKTTHPATAYQGYYTLGLTQPDTDSGKPQGTGFAAFTVDLNSGVLITTPSLADGTTFTNSAFVGPQGQVLLHQLLYASKGSFSGTLNIASDSIGTISGTPAWSRPPIAGRVYKNGFGAVNLNAFGSRYVKPDPGDVVMDLNNVDSNAQVSFTAAGLTHTAGSTPDSIVSIRNLSASATTNTTKPPSPNPAKLSVMLDSITGKFSGGVTVPGATVAQDRSTTYQGIIVRQASGSTASGWFLLAQPPDTGETLLTSPQMSGKVMLQAH